jgi:hypothetical protein
MKRWLKIVDEHISNINKSKIFAGLMIIIINVAAKFVNFKLSKNVELYLKHTFSTRILIFAIAWMGTRDIYTAIIITLVFIFCVDYLFNESSCLCCLPESFTNYHEGLDKPDDKAITSAIDILKKAGKLNDEDVKKMSI